MFIICASIPSSHDEGTYIYITALSRTALSDKDVLDVLIPHFLSNIPHIYIATQWVGSTQVKARIL